MRGTEVVDVASELVSLFGCEVQLPVAHGPARRPVLEPISRAVRECVDEPQQALRIDSGDGPHVLSGRLLSLGCKGVGLQPAAAVRRPPPALAASPRALILDDEPMGSELAEVITGRSAGFADQMPEPCSRGGPRLPEFREEAEPERMSQSPQRSRIEKEILAGIESGVAAWHCTKIPLHSLLCNGLGAGHLDARGPSGWVRNGEAAPVLSSLECLGAR